MTTDFLWADDSTLVQSACTLGWCETTLTDDQGFATSVGLRGAASERVGLYGDLTYYNTDLESALVNMNGDGITLEVGARVTPIENLLLSLGYAKQGDFESLQAGIRVVL